MADTINDHVAVVQTMLGNRTDLASGSPSQIAVWLKNAYLELAYNYSFAELETTVDGLVTVPGIDTIDYPAQLTRVKAITFYRDDDTAIAPEWKDMKFLRAFSKNAASNQGSPAVVTNFGTKIFMRPFPDVAYDCIIDGWGAPEIQSDVVSTTINLPLDWLEILEYSAALRGHVSLLERDRAMEIQQYLFGFKTDTGKQVPGVITNRLTRRQAEAPYSDYGMQPRSVKRSYT